MDEGLQYAAQRRLPYDMVQTAYDRCHDFVDGDASSLGDPADWLRQSHRFGAAARNGEHRFQIVTSRNTSEFGKAGGLPTEEGNAAIDSKVGPRDLLLSAVRSKDPEVLFTIGEAQSMLDPTSNDEKTNRFAWWLVACQRGLNCSATADWVKTSCGGDPQCASADSPSDLMRDLAGDDWPSVQQRAQDIGAKLDAGQWNELGIGA